MSTKTENLHNFIKTILKEQGLEPYKEICPWALMQQCTVYDGAELEKKCISGLGLSCQMCQQMILAFAIRDLKRTMQQLNTAYETALENILKMIWAIP